MLLEFINELMHSDASLPKVTYEAKKYLKDLGLEYEKISACRKGCMLFWRENEKLDKCTLIVHVLMYRPPKQLIIVCMNMVKL
jgi:hypothetical protein